MRWMLAIAAAGLLAGCAQQRMEEAKAAQAQASALCHQIPEQQGSTLRRANCLIAARDQYFAIVAPGDADLLAVVDAEQQKMADDVDAGRMSIPDYRVAVARAVAQASSESQARRRQNMMAQAAVLAATPQPAFQAPTYQAPLYQAPAIPQPVTCNSYAMGNNVQTTCH